MNELGRDSRALLDAARAGDDPAPDEKMRMRVRLAQLGVGMAVTTVSATAAGGGAAVASVAAKGVASATASVGAAASAGAGSAVVVGSSLGALAAKLAVTIAIVGTLAAAGTKGVTVYRAHHPGAVFADVPAPIVTPAFHPSEAVGGDPSVATTAPAAEVAAAVPDLEAATSPAAETRRSDTAASSPSARASGPSSTLEAETRLLRDAEALRRAGDGARALALLDEHATRFPSGLLAEERAASRVFALCDLGRVIDATAEAQRFLLERPRSPLAPRVRASCAEARLR